MKRLLLLFLGFVGISQVSCFKSKHYVWRVGAVSRRNVSVQKYSTIAEVSEKDKEQIFQQLGYVPSNLVSVAARRGGDFKTPLVLKTYPLNGGASRRKAKAEGSLTPFPTLFWFCCKDVGKAIADLERRGFVKRLEKRLSEPGMLEQFVKCHDEYARERWESLSYEHQQYVSRNDRMVRILRDSGIAGTDYGLFLPLQKPSIKCLHAHYGHYRSQIEKYSKQNVDEKIKDIEGINIVGLWIDELLRSEYPDLIL